MRTSLLVLVVLAEMLGAPPSRAQRDVSLGLDLAADEKLERCLTLVGQDQIPAAHACFDEVIASAPDSTAAIRARSAKATLDKRPPAVANADLILPPVKKGLSPGRLELTVATGAFGVWSGVAVAAFLGSQSGFLPPVASATGGAVAVGLGGAMAVGTFLLGELLDLDAGTSHLIASGMGWGSLFGLALAPWVFSLQGARWPDGAFLPDLSNWQRTVPPVLLTSVGFGWLGTGISTATALVLDFDPGQVATMNTGIAVGLYLGVTLSPILGAINFGQPIWLAPLYLSMGAVGLAGGTLMAYFIQMEAWEVALVDAATALVAGLLGTAAVAGYYATGQGNHALNAVLGGVAGVGTVATLVGGTAVVAYFRIAREQPFSRLGFIPIDRIFVVPEVSFDRAGKPTTGIALGGAF